MHFKGGLFMFTEINGIKIHYTDEGSGPEVLFLHGWGASAASYSGVIKSLSNKCRCVALDFPGCGESDLPENPLNINDYLSLVIKFLDAAKLTNPILIGHSHGCRVIMKLCGTGLLNPPKIVMIDGAGIKPRFNFKKEVKVKTFKTIKWFLTLPIIRNYTEETIKKSGVQDVFLLGQQHVAGVSYGQDEDGFYHFTIRGNKAVLVIDDVICYDKGAGNMIATFNKNDIEQIDVLKPPFSGFFDPRFRNGFVAITTKKGGENYNAKWIKTNIKRSMPLGFQLPTEFYAPKYEFTAEKENKAPDLRTTIYWNPAINIKEGKADFEFYTADGLIDYSIVIEGVSDDGRLLRVEKEIK